MLRWLSCLCMVLLLGCQPQAPAQIKEIRMAVAQPALNLDPRYATDAVSARVNRLLYRALVRFDDASHVQPDLASWQAVTSKQYVFTLNQSGRSFHDGSRLNAEDIAATYQSLPQINSPLSAEFANIQQVTVLNNEQVKFELREADADFVSKLIIGILPAAKIHQQHDFNQAPIGSGPLRFVARDNTLHLARVADGQPIRLLEIKDPTVRVLKLLHGEVDILQGDLPPELVAYLQKKTDIQVDVSKGANFSYLGLNLRDKRLQQAPVRQALAYAIDTQAIVAHALVPGSRPATAILPPEHWAGNPALQPYPYQPAKARQLLQQAGVSLPLQLEYKTSSDPQRLRLATMLQAQMRPAGIQLNIKSHDWGTFFGDIQQGRFQLYGLTWVGIHTPDIYVKAFASDALPPKGFNRGGLKDLALDRMLAQRDWLAATQRIHQQLPYVPLWYEGQVVAYRNNIKHFSAKPDGNWDDLAIAEKQI